MMRGNSSLKDDVKSSGWLKKAQDGCSEAQLLSEETRAILPGSPR